MNQILAILCELVVNSIGSFRIFELEKYDDETFRFPWTKKLFHSREMVIILSGVLYAIEH